MKTKYLYLGTSLSLAALLSAPLYGQTNGTWSKNSNSNWSDSATWDGGVAPSGAGAVVTLDNTNFTSGRRLTVDQDVTVGSVIGEGTGTQTRNFDGSGVNVITLDNGSNPAFFQNNGLGSMGSTATFKLNGDLIIKNNHAETSGGRFLTVQDISSATSGLKTVTTVGPDNPHSNSGSNDYRIVISGAGQPGIHDGAGTVAFVHASGGNLNIQNDVGNDFSGGLTITNNSNYVITGSNPANGDTALGAENGAITFDNGNLVYSAATTHIQTSARATLLAAGGGDIRVSSASGSLQWNGVISGSGDLTVSGSGAISLTQANQYTGNTIIDGAQLEIESGASLLFALENNSVSNHITGSGDLVYGGNLTIDISNFVPQGNSDSWNLIDVAALGDVSYESTFAVVEADGALTFIDDGAGMWMSNDSQWSFEESTGNLLYIPEPSTLSLVAGLFVLSVFRRRRA